MQKILTTRFPNNPTAIQHFGGLLEEYQDSGFAPPNMNNELVIQDDKGIKFWSHVWEAILYRHLRSLGLTFVESKVKKSGQTGSDFGVIYSGKTIWIEAIVPEPIGIPEDYLKPETNLNPISQLQRELSSRWTH